MIGAQTAAALADERQLGRTIPNGKLRPVAVRIVFVRLTDLAFIRPRSTSQRSSTLELKPLKKKWALFNKSKIFTSITYEFAKFVKIEAAFAPERGW